MIMNALKNIYLILFLALSITLVSCDDEDDPITKSRTEMLTAGVWTGDKVIEDGEDVTDIWRESSNPWDMQKYSIEFLEDGTYIQRYEGQPDQSGTWEFIRDEEFIEFNGVEKVEVGTLENDELQLIYDREGVEQEHFFVR